MRHSSKPQGGLDYNPLTSAWSRFRSHPLYSASF